MGITFNESFLRFVSNYVPISEKILSIQINTRPVNLKILQIYKPTSDKSDEEVDQFYDNINNILKTKKNEITIVMEDANSKVDLERSLELVGP